MKFKRNTKGELSTQQIVLIIILIISFVVLLFFLYRMNLGKQTIQDICHDSVVKKATIVGEAQKTPLQCSQTDICITKDGTCEGLTTNYDKVKVKTEQEVYEELAKDMANCWWMFGEGKVDYVGKAFWFRDNYCSICYQVFFDDSLKEIPEFKNGISKDNLYDYMAKNNLSSTQKITYAKYIFGDINFDESKKILNTSSFGSIDLGKNYFILMGITEAVEGRGWKIAGATVIAIGSYIACPFTGTAGCIIGSSILGGIIYGGSEVAGQIDPEIGALIVKGNGIDNNFMAPTIQEAHSDKFKALNCEDIITRG